MTGIPLKRCKSCMCARSGDKCFKCGSELFEVGGKWEEPELPDVSKIRELAKEVGYAIGEHGSKERDLDLIACPWTEDAVGSHVLLTHLEKGLNARCINMEIKPHGRLGISLQIDGYFKLIDLSIMPRQKEKEE